MTDRSAAKYSAMPQVHDADPDRPALSEATLSHSAIRAGEGRMQIEYARGIALAERLGLIEYAPDRGSASGDAYSHLDSKQGGMNLTNVNSRALAPLAQLVVKALRAERGMKVIELGSGSGAALSELSQILPHSELHSVGLTPINPFLRFRSRGDVEPRLLQRQSMGDPSTLFEVCAEPYIAKQYIGHFPNSVRVPRQAFQFVYEMYGPIYHLTSCSTDSEHAAFCNRVLDLLHPQGVMYLGQVSSKQTSRVMKSTLLERDPQALVLEVSGGIYDVFPSFIFARGASPVRPMLEPLSGRKDVSVDLVRDQFSLNPVTE